jgi:hypothetical protein
LVVTTTPAAQTALTTLETTNPSDTAAVKAAIATLGNLMSTQVPDAPLLYGADWDEYSTAHFTGFVTQEPVHGPVTR